MQWRLTGTFAGPGSLSGIAPTGDPIVIEGFDLLTVRDGLIQSNDAFPDSIALPRQIGMMPPQGSTADQRLTGAFNAKTRLTSRLSGGEAELVAEGVWVVQGQPGRCNVYLIEDDGGVTLFDAGARTMTRAVAQRRREAGRHPPGGARPRAHRPPRHRARAGRARAVPPRRGRRTPRAAAAGATGRADLAGLPPGTRQLQRLLHRYAWDGGPVKIAGTLTEGDEIAGFRVVHLPGHAPGLIALWRESDRLALSSDCFYTIDMWGRNCDPPRARSDSTTSTPTRRARACASSPRSSRRPHGPDTPSRSPATCARSWSAPPSL